MDNVIVLATGNQNKLKEIQALLKESPITVKTIKDFGPMPEAVEDGETFDDNAYKKALHYAKMLGLPCLADDSGLVVNALDGRPGVYSARYSGENATDWDNCEKLLAEMQGKADRSAYFMCVLSLATPQGPALTWEGRCDGEILEERRGEAGFGYDPIFFFPDLGKTFAEASMEEKSKVSHRGKALQEFAAEISKIQVWLRQRFEEHKPEKPDHAEFEHNDWSQERMV
ncbi:XTP/dITP diphosphatase [Desulfogranum mediterraneum]|uniref:XTP/dITP diphosphatase n=1 Tax=Desulfogranum mediterraneum TaxID=160661 RepID=UPI0003FF9F8B|nr:XTP/dITP diphosphatase [Desulfogranum mediterraneum]